MLQLVHFTQFRIFERGPIFYVGKDKRVRALYSLAFLCILIEKKIHDFELCLLFV